MLRLLPALEGVEAHVILAEEGPLVSRLERLGIAAEVVPLTRSLRELPRDKIALWQMPLYVAAITAYAQKLQRRIRQLKPDLIQTNSLKSAVYGSLVGKLAGVPVVWHIRDRIAENYLPSAGRRVVRSLARRFPAAVIANSHTTLATLHLPAGIPGAVVFDPIQKTSRKSNPIRSDPTFTVGMVGRISRWKGQDVFIRAFENAFPFGPERAVVVGAPLFGEDDYANELRDLAAQSGLNGRLEFAGFQDEVALQFHRFDVLVHASVIPEPFGQVIVEGMAAGLPVVATAAGGPAEIITDGENGLLYRPGDWQALSSILRRLASEPPLRRRLGRSARRRARDFTPELAGEQVKAVYQRVLGRSV